MTSRIFYVANLFNHPFSLCFNKDAPIRLVCSRRWESIGYRDTCQVFMVIGVLAKPRISLSRP